jgi:site-specific recombinase XerD|tara:strand:+ start:6896 stop:7810 length:915 start_codon:yes stop_codon:yes gene_type:complete
MKKFDKIKTDFLDFLQYDKGYSERTIENYQRDITKFEVYITEFSINYKKLSKENIFDFHSDLSSSIGPRSFSRILSSLRTLYKYLFSQKLINDIVLNNIQSYPSPKFKKSIPSFLSQEKIYDILAKIDKSTKNSSIKIRDKAIIMLFFTSGLRLEEMTNLILRDIDFDNNSIKVLGKGGKERYSNFDDLTHQLIIDYLNKIRKFPLSKSNIDDNLFVDKDNRSLTRNNIQYIVTSNLKGLSLSAFGPHTLRHSFATHLLNKGVGISAIQSLLGHAKLSSTQIYTHVSLEKLQDTIDKAHPRGKK